MTNAAKLTVAVARIALPPIPAPGETVTNDELLDPVSTSEATDEESPTWQAIIASVPESAARLTERSQLAKQLLVGFLTAGALVLAAGAIARRGAGPLLRPQPDRRRPGHGGLRLPVAAVRRTMVCVGASRPRPSSIPTGVAIRLCLWYPHSAWLVLSIYAAGASWR